MGKTNYAKDISFLQTKKLTLIVYLKPPISLYPMESKIWDEKWGHYVSEVVIDPALQPQLSHGSIHQGEARPSPLPGLQVSSIAAPGLILIWQNKNHHFYTRPSGEQHCCYRLDPLDDKAKITTFTQPPPPQIPPFSFFGTYTTILHANTIAP